LPVKPDTYGHDIEEWCEGETDDYRPCARKFDFEDKVEVVDIDECGKFRAACCNNKIVVFERSSADENFNRSWAEYKEGFGTPEKHNFFIGLDKLHCLTQNGEYRVSVEEKTVSGKWYSGNFKTVTVAGEDEKFKITLETYQGTTDAALDLSGQFFSTFDRDNDKSVYSSCADINGGGWWFDNCYKVCYTCDYLRHFEDKELGADSHLKYARVALIRSAPSQNEAEEESGRRAFTDFSGDGSNHPFGSSENNSERSSERSNERSSGRNEENSRRVDIHREESRNEEQGPKIVEKPAVYSRR